MTTYFIGTGIEAFVTSVSGAYDADGYVYVDGNPSSFIDAYPVDPVTGRRTALNTVWIHATMTIPYSYVYGDRPPFSWLNSDGVAVLRLVGTGFDPRMGMYPQAWDGVRWVSVGSVQVLGAGTIDAFIHVHPTDGAIRIYYNNALAWEIAGGVTANFKDIARLRMSGGNGENGHAFGQVILASYNTIAHAVRRRRPIGPGSHGDWTGSYADVDDQQLNDGDAISTSEVGAVSTFAGDVLPPPGEGLMIKAVAIGARLRNGGGDGPANVRALLRIDGADYVAPYDLAIGSGYAGAIAVFDKDPATGRAWDSIDHVNGEFGLKATA